jgi:hypothetical protein
MKERTLTLPLVGLIAGTRVALGIGIGFLLADKLGYDRRRGAGIALLIVGALSTVPLAIAVLSKTEERSRLAA